VLAWLGACFSVFSVVVVSAAFSFLAQPSSIAIIATAASMQTPNRIQVDFVILESPLVVVLFDGESVIPPSQRAPPRALFALP
jgi:hypothetical protein